MSQQQIGRDFWREEIRHQRDEARAQLAVAKLNLEICEKVVFELRDALQVILDDAIYTTKDERCGEELRGYLQTVRGHARPALKKDEGRLEDRET